MGRSPLTIALDLPTDGTVLNIVNQCSKPIRLSEVKAYPVEWGITRAEITIPQKRESYLALLRCLTKVNKWSLNKWTFPTLYDSGAVRYVEEPMGQEIWQSIPALYKRGIGDCEDLTSARVAELDHFGINAREKLVQTGRSDSGGRLFHFLVEHKNGRLEDPSKILGMV